MGLGGVAPQTPQEKALRPNP